MPTETDKVNTGALATIIVAGAMFVAGVAAGVTALVRHQVNVVGDEVGAQADLQPVQKLKADQRAELAAAPAWEDKDQGTVDIPIDRAMQLVVADISQNPEAATPASAAPAPAPAPAAGDAGAAPAPDESKKPAPEQKKPAVPANNKPAPAAPKAAPQPAPGGNAP